MDYQRTRFSHTDREFRALELRILLPNSRETEAAIPLSLLLHPAEQQTSCCLALRLARFSHWIARLKFVALDTGRRVYRPREDLDREKCRARHKGRKEDVRRYGLPGASVLQSFQSPAFPTFSVRFTVWLWDAKNLESANRRIDVARSGAVLVFRTQLLPDITPFSSKYSSTRFIIAD